MAFASAGSGGQPELGVRIRATGDADVRGAFDRIRAQGRATFDALGRSVETTKSHIASVGSLTSSTVRGAETVASGAIGVVTGLVGHLASAVSFAAGQFTTLAEAAGVSGIVAGAGFAGALSAVGSYIDKNQAAVTSLVQLSEQTGLSVESISAMQAAVRLAGGDTENLNKSVEHLSDAYFKSAQAGDEASSPFLHIGVATKDATGRLRPFADVMNDTVHALAGIPNVAERGRAAMEVFGESYHDVLDIISNDVDEKGLVTTFEDRLRAAYAHGTVLDEAKAKARQDLENDNSEINEDLRDVGNTLTEAFLPLTGAANPFVRWIASNKEAVKGFLVDLASGIIHFKSDIETIFSTKKIATHDVTAAKGKAAKGGDDDDDSDDDDDDGDSSSSDGDGVHLHFAALETAVPILRGARDVVVDLFSAIRGTAKLGDTVPALGQLAYAAREMGGAFVDTVSDLAAFVGLTRADLPSVADVLHGVGAAFRSLRDGLKGGDGDTDYPVLQAIGQVVRQVLGTLGLLAAALIGDRASIEAFATGALHVLRDALEAVRAVIQGGLVPQGNLFSWLDPLIPYVQRALGLIRQTFESAFGQVTFADLEDASRQVLTTVGQALLNLATLAVEAFGALGRAVQGVLPYLRAVARALGLTDANGNGDAGQLLIAGLIVWFTGLLPVLGAVLGLVLEFVIALGSLASALRLVGTIVYPVLEVVALGLAALLGIPVWVAGAIVAGIAAAALAIYAYWDDIADGATALVEVLRATFGRLVDVAIAVGIGIWTAFVAPFQWIWAIIEQTGKLFGDLWALVTGGGRKAWEDLRADWSKLLDLFLQPIVAIGQAFDALWAKLKSGASGAWGYVKHLFGGDSQETVERQVYGEPGTVNAPDGSRTAPDGHPVPPADIPDQPGETPPSTAAPAATTPAATVPTTPIAVPQAAAPSSPGILETIRRALSPAAPAPAPAADDDGPLPDGGWLDGSDGAAPVAAAPIPQAAAAPSPSILEAIRRALSPATSPAPTALDLSIPAGSIPDALGTREDLGTVDQAPDVGSSQDDALDAAVPAPSAPSVVVPLPEGSIADAMSSIQDSMSTARTSIAPAMADDQPAQQAMAPLTLVIGGQTIDGLAYPASALEQLRQAQRTVSISGRAPAMRGSGY